MVLAMAIDLKRGCYQQACQWTGNDSHEFTILESPCIHCKVLEFDDLKHGGDVQISENGARFVSFGGGDNADRKNTELRLGYRREDSLPDLPELAKTGLGGCAFCDILRKDIMSAWEESVEKKLNQNLPEREKTNHANLLITEIEYQYRKSHEMDVEMTEKGPWLDTLVVNFMVYFRDKETRYSLHYNFHTDSSDACASWLKVWRRPILGDALSTTRLKRLNELIHASLQVVPCSTENIYLPTRLIDVGLSPSLSPRLVISKTYQPLVGAGDPASKRYIALSYCWGSKEEADQQLKTTNDTLEDHLKQIDFERMPKTIADAITVCRKTGIRYIWIDALCIIQGDENDWARESFEMSNVYANSFLTLCVLRGSSCVSGFLENRDMRPTLGVKFRSTVDPSVSGTLYLRMLQQKVWRNLNDTSLIPRISSPDEPAWDDINDASWSKRAWTFQEALLSRRKVFFGDSMFHMSCGKLQESEDGTKFYDDTQRQPFSLSSTADKPDVRTALREWYLVVGRYAGRKLAYAQDKLTAISAPARIVSELYPDLKYLAGLWESELAGGLLWTTNAWMDPQTYLSKLQEEYIAPSWTWACNQHMISWVWGVNDRDHKFTAEFELRKAEVTTHEENPYGRVYSGHLLLHAKMFQLPCQDDGRPHVTKAQSPEYIWLGIIFHYTLRSNENEYIAHFHLDWDFCGALNSEDYPDGPVDRLWMVLISSSNLNGSNMSSRPYLTDPEIMLGLLVLKADNEDGFRKVGLFYSENRHLGGRKFWDSIEPCEVKLV
ncbi:HET-domain-containing protein [Hypoxylon crocopeplum]|nr:HET-domain-containing protein [Hypoxylon crocopeplum]